ncbi:MAG TPA: hypothetical protein VK518_22395 [Puia sp.]|nr:hypothetical protein [Puia sp.]
MKGNRQGKLLGSGKELVEVPLVHPQVIGEDYFWNCLESEDRPESNDTA